MRLADLHTKKKSILVKINIYDLIKQNSYTIAWGFGAFHTGVEIGGWEYSFGGHEFDGTGVYKTTPKTAPGVAFRETIELGEGFMSQKNFEDIIADLSDKYQGRSYNIIALNCNHFADELCRRLLNKPIPSYINRLPVVIKSVQCLIPANCFPIPPAQNDNPLYETPAIKEVAPVYVNEKIREMNSNEDLVARREKLALAALKRLNQSNNE